jgi:hypothetical protein
VDERRGDKSMLKAVKDGEGDVLVIYKKVRSLYWFTLSRSIHKITPRWFQLPFSISHDVQY